MGLYVQKYGGTSVANTDRIRHVAERVVKAAEQGHELVVVVSAMGHATDELVGLARQLNGVSCAREMDMLLSTGEQVSVALLSMAVQALGWPSVSLTGGQAGIRTEAVHGKARILNIDTDCIRGHLAEGRVVIVAGFQGITETQEITTLGRGGSDTTAVALAAALGADLCEICTDVDGVYTTDPRVVSCAQKIDAISYDEMLELANLGAAVLHPRSVEFAKQSRVPLMVRCSFHDKPGTLVTDEENVGERLAVRGIAHDDQVVKVGLVNAKSRTGNLKRIFQALGAASINVHLIINSVVHEEDRSDLSLLISDGDLEPTLDVLRGILPEFGAAEIAVEENLAKVSIVGSGMIEQPGVAEQMFANLAQAGIDIKMVTTSEIKVSVVVEREFAHRAVQTLHSSFGLDGALAAVVSGMDE